MYMNEGLLKLKSSTSATMRAGLTHLLTALALMLSR